MSFSENRFPLFHSASQTRVDALLDMRQSRAGNQATTFTASKLRSACQRPQDLL
jgi:hypothetical protein